MVRARPAHLSAALVVFFAIGSLFAGAQDVPPASAPSTSLAKNISRIEVTFDSDVLDQPYTGRVWVFTNRSFFEEPRFGPDWFRPNPFFAVDVTDWRPGTPLVMDDDAILCFPKRPDEVLTRGARVQAVMRLNRDARSPGAGAGNVYSDVERISDTELCEGVVRLRVTQVVQPERFNETDRIKPFEVVSRLLSKFHGREMRVTGAVILPDAYDADEERRFPTLYIFPGFGQTRDSAPFYMNAAMHPDAPLVQVLLDAECATGFHEFADSENNGPCGQALIEEVIPYLEKTFRLVAEPAARFVCGHSSGGWASLWVQVAYPDYFGGAWPTSPDPVDFRDFTGINIYEKNANVFRDAKDRPRPIARMGGQVAIWFKAFSDMEVVVGPGEQLGSFEAVFSPRGPDGQPMKLWDRRTGDVDPKVAKAWEKYDIRLILERNWAVLGPKLAGKLRVYCGDTDTFYLEGAVAMLKESLEKLGSDADIRLLKNKDHFSLAWSPEFKGIQRAAGEKFLASVRHAAEEFGGKAENP